METRHMNQSGGFMKTIKINEKCGQCCGTGLYVGMAEKKGAAVVCRSCKGTGCFKFVHKYEEFEEKVKSVGVKRVFASNPGIIIGEDSGLKLEDFGGISLEDWEKGAEFSVGSENRKFTCPHWWYQSVDYKRKPDWSECALGVIFSQCHHFSKNEGCWERWDKEFLKE